MKQVRQFFSPSEPDPISASDSLVVWQVKILQTSLLLASLFGLVLGVFSIGSALTTGNWLFLAADLVFTLGSILLFLLRKIPLCVRSIIVLALFFTFTNLIFLQRGWSGLTLILLIGFSSLCTALFDKQTKVTGLLVGFVTLMIWAYFSFARQLSTLPNIAIDSITVVFLSFLGYLMIDSLRLKLLQEHVLYADSKIQFTQLEAKISLGKTEVEKSLLQLKVTTEISQIAATASDLQFVQKQAADLLQARFDLYYVGVFLLDQSGEYAILHYGTGDPGRRMLTSSYRLAVGGYSLVGKAINGMEAKLSSENDPSSERFENPFLPESRSELAIPFIKGNATFGAINIHSTNPGGFSENDRLVFQQTADLLALTLDKNAATNQQSMAYKPKTYSLRPSQSAEEKEIQYSFENPLASQTVSETSKVQVPLVLRDQTIGSIDLEIAGKELTKDQNEFLQTVSAQTSIALENASLLDQTLQRANRERKVLEITSKIRSTNDSQKMLQIALEELSQNLGVSKAQIVLNVPEKPRTEEVSETTTKTINRKRTTGELHEP